MYRTLICSNCCVSVRCHRCVSCLIIISIIRCYPLIGRLCYWSAVMLCVSRDPCIRIFVSVKSSLLIVLGESRMWMAFFTNYNKNTVFMNSLIMVYIRTASLLDHLTLLNLLTMNSLPFKHGLHPFNKAHTRQISALACGVLIKSTEIYFHSRS